ncbi:MAG: ketose-bisphosphate aldolase [Oscillospiraceae bacterium]|nr:ketose-bisphosphate aldolase [Oscillospiraceae bacterium]
MLVSAKEMLNKAVAGKYAIPQININNLEWTKAAITTAQALNSPIILGVTSGAASYMGGFKTVVGMANGMMDDLRVTVPVALHLDHGSYDAAVQCIEAGFSSIMYDGSHEDIDKNVANTKKFVEICNSKGLSLEAEVGAIGGEEDGVIGSGENADPDECKAIADLGVTMLAAGIGNIHGSYPPDWAGLNFSTLRKIKEKVGDLPLVLHGGTGIPAEMIQEAISLGVAKINVNTECQWLFQSRIRDYIMAGKDLLGKQLDKRTLKAIYSPQFLVDYFKQIDEVEAQKYKHSYLDTTKGQRFVDKAINGFDPRKLLQPGIDGIKEVVTAKMELFGSKGKA